MPVFSVKRAGVAVAAAVVAFTALGGRVGYLQTYKREETIQRVERQQHREQTLPARRGCVFDRNGLLMAGTQQSNLVFIDPMFLQKEFERAAKEELALREERAALKAKGKWPRPSALLTPEQQAKAAAREEAARRAFPVKYAPWDGPGAAIEVALADVADLLHLDGGDVFKKVLRRPEARYVKIAELVDDETVAAIRALKIPGIGFQPMSVRAYPMDDVAAHVLGGVGAEERGQGGLELQYDYLLRGKNGYLRELTDSKGKPIAVSSDDYAPPTHGRHLVLTIDANIQLIAEEELRNSVREFGAKSGEVVVMDPWTGEVLALANWPTYRPVEYSEISKDAKPDPRMNRALFAPYEPGSTIKPFVVAPALEWKVASPGEMFNTYGGEYRPGYGKRVIKDVHGYPQLTLWDVLVKSSNVGMAKLGERMQDHRIRYGLSLFGFGRSTGIELPGEARGWLRALTNWNKDYSKHSIVQGYELLVTPLQLARATSIIANGGTMVRPTIVRGMVEGRGEIGAVSVRRKAGAGTGLMGAGGNAKGTDGNSTGTDGAVLASYPMANVVSGLGSAGVVTPAELSVGGIGSLRSGDAGPPVVGAGVLDPVVASEMRQMMADVMVRGTGTKARSAVYNIFGKTGTAHLIEPGTRSYSQSRYTSSFIGSTPYEHPRLVVAFIIHEAQAKNRQYFGGTTAAPGASRVLERSLKYLGVPASSPLQPPEASIAGRLINFDEKKYSGWPANVIKERAQQGKEVDDEPMMRPPALAPGQETPPKPEPVEPVLPVDPTPTDPDSRARPASDPR